MKILDHLMKCGPGQPDYLTPHRLREIWNSYSDKWPANNERYVHWKPASVLPAPKWVIKHAIKFCYAEWPAPIDWIYFSAFFMEFTDLALHLPQEKYDAIENFRKRQIECSGGNHKHDPLSMYGFSSGLAASYSVENCNQVIIQIRDGLRQLVALNPLDADDHELDSVRDILLECAVDFASLIQEWRFYVLSIGRDQYITRT